MDIREEIIASSFSADPIFLNTIAAMIKTESGFDSEAMSDKGAIGLLQVTPIAVKEIYNTVIAYKKEDQTTIEKFKSSFILRCSNIRVDMLTDIRHNIKAGSCYYALMIHRHHNKVMALAAYNGGRAQVIRFYNKGDLVKETSLYINKVFFNKELLCEL